MTTTSERPIAGSIVPVGARHPAPLGNVLRWGRAPAVGALSAVDLLWTSFVLAMFGTMGSSPASRRSRTT